MSTAIQLGQDQIPLPKIFQHLTTSPSLYQYLRLAIIEETISQWEDSVEYQTICERIEPSASADLRNSVRVDASQIERVNQSLTLQQYQQVRWGHRIASYFLARKSQLDRAIFSAIQIEDGSLVQEVYLRVQDRQQSFGKLARLFSQGDEARFGGTIGPIALNRIHPQIVYHLMTLEPGELSPIFQIDNFHVFIRLEQYLPARFDEEMKVRLLDELFEQWLQIEVKNCIPNFQLTVLSSDRQIDRNFQSKSAEDRNWQLPLPSSPTTDRAANPLLPSTVKFIDADSTTISDEDLSPAIIQPSTSFFLPTSETLTSDLNVGKIDSVAPELRQLQSIMTDRREPTRSPCNKSLSYKIAATCLSFSLLLCGVFGTIVSIDYLVKMNGIRIERDK